MKTIAKTCFTGKSSAAKRVEKRLPGLHATWFLLCCMTVVVVGKKITTIIICARSWLLLYNNMRKSLLLLWLHQWPLAKANFGPPQTLIETADICWEINETAMDCSTWGWIIIRLLDWISDRKAFWLPPQQRCKWVNFEVILTVIYVRSVL